MEQTAVIERLKQRFPFVLIDKVLDLVPSSRCVGLKNVSVNDAYFQMSRNDTYVLPSSFIIEAMAQTATVLIINDQALLGTSLQFHQVTKCTFHGQVYPGDQLRLELEYRRKKEDRVYFTGQAFVDGALRCESELVFSLSQLPSKPSIHPTASVHPTAILGQDVEIGPYSIIGENVIIGDRTVIGAHVQITRWTQIGENNHIHFGSVIGAPPQDTKYKGEKSWVILGDNNAIREYVTIHRATGEGEVTQLGSDNMIMINAHIGHNCIINDNVTMANMVTLGGHVEIGSRSVIGGMTGVHQFVRIGQGTMTGGYARLIQDVPPFMLCDGNPAYVRGLNAVGLKRNGIKGEVFKGLKSAYKSLYRSQLNLKQALSEIDDISPSEPLSVLVNFLKEPGSVRGISKKVDVGSEE